MYLSNEASFNPSTVYFIYSIKIQKFSSLLQTVTPFVIYNTSIERSSSPVTPLRYFNGVLRVKVTRRAARDSNNLVARLKYPDKIKSLDDVAEGVSDPVLVTLKGRTRLYPPESRESGKLRLSEIRSTNVEVFISFRAQVSRDIAMIIVARRPLTLITRIRRIREGGGECTGSKTGAECSGTQTSSLHRAFRIKRMPGVI